jgi:Ankyrin repeats (many copies)
MEAGEKEKPMTKFSGKKGWTKQGFWGKSPLIRVGALMALGLTVLTTGCSTTAPQNKNLRLIRAAEKGETREIVGLLRDGADINAMDEQGWTPYLAASTNGHLDAMKLLRAFGARTEAPEKETLARFNMVR